MKKDSIVFLSVLHQNKISYNFCKRDQHSIVKHNAGLEYALLGVRVALKLENIKKITN